MQARILQITVKNRYRWTVTTLTGLFMFVVLYLYRAYHIDALPAFTGHNVLFRALAHSLIVSFVFYLTEFHLSKYIRVNERFKLIITALAATFIGLNITFLTFNYFYHWTELYWSSYLKFLYEYPLVLLFPVTLSILIHRIRIYASSKPNNLIVFTSENQKEQFQLKARNLLFIKSAGNYVEVHFLTGQEVKRQLIRKSLKSIEEEHPSSPFIERCHRSYLINPLNIDHTNWTSHHIEISISGRVIPVSKTYADLLSKKLLHSFIPHSKISSQID